MTGTLWTIVDRWLVPGLCRLRGGHDYRPVRLITYGDAAGHSLPVRCMPDDPRRCGRECYRCDHYLPERTS